MNIVVLIKMVPDLVEELTVGESGASLERDWLRLIINEFDDHALEQAILLKEQYGGQVTVFSPDTDGTDDVLFAAAARGADHVIKLSGDFDEGLNNHALARALNGMVRTVVPDLVLTGVQAHDDLDGSVGPMLAEYLELPYVGYISDVSLKNGICTVQKEYPGGLLAEMEVKLPAVLGVQAAANPPRYVAISKIRQAMKSIAIDEQEITDLVPDGGPVIERMFPSESGEKAIMIEGDEEEVAARLIEIFRESGLV
jgi:electron transfer flavoprotein beta subunit